MPKRETRFPHAGAAGSVQELIMMRQHRNPVAAAPILRKGGAHQKSRSAERAKDRAQLKREIIEWRSPR